MIGKAIKLGLINAGFIVDWVQDGRAAELAVANDVYQLIVLDLGLPRRSGLDILKSTRARHSDIPILIATARDAVGDRIEGLNAGADDYLVKPFNLGELVARVRALLRRSVGRGSPLQEYGAITLDDVNKVLTLRGSVVDLSAREFSIMETLMQRPGAVLSKEALEEAVYGWDQEIGSNAIEVHLHNLRKKLGTDVIKNVRGVGYRIQEI